MIKDTNDKWKYFLGGALAGISIALLFQHLEERSRERAKEIEDIKKKMEQDRIEFEQSRNILEKKIKEVLKRSQDPYGSFMIEYNNQLDEIKKMAQNQHYGLRPKNYHLLEKS